MNRPIRNLLIWSLMLTPTVAFADDLPNLGTVVFPNSGAPQAQEPFLRGVLLLHSFEFEDSLEAFQEAQEIDPDFALAYWGEAMTHNHPLWRQQDREAALAALARYAPTAEERAAKAPSEREAGYLATLDVLYAEGDDKTARDLAYEEAMRELSEKYPEDMEARAFYSLSILGSTNGTRDFATYMRAGAVAEEVFAAIPRHPGAVHYLIHSYDDPIHAPLGLRAAKVYAEIAPAASHAQHMISHIFVAMGRWEDSVESNIKAYEVSKERRERKGLPVDSLNYHALYWLQYSYLQLGQFDNARSVLDMLGSYAEESRSERAVWHYAMMRAMWNVETGGLDSPQAVDREVLELSGAVHDLFGEGYVAIRSGDVAGAEKSLAAMRQIRAAIEAEKSDENGPYNASYAGSLEVAEILELSLAGLIVIEGGASEAGFAMLDRATAMEASRALEYGPPTIVKPSHELYAEALLAAGQPERAAEQVAIALQRAPRRTRSLLALARSAAATGDGATLATACGELSSILAQRDDGAPSADICATTVKAATH